MKMKNEHRRTYSLSEEACEILATATIRTKRHPSDLVSEAIIRHLSDKIKEMPYKNDDSL